MANRTNLSFLESLPRDLLVEIFSRAASSSRESIRSCLTLSTTITSAVLDNRVFKHLTLRPQAMNPLVTYAAYNDLMKKCLQNDNPVARYIEGIKQYFVQDSTVMGLFHLRKSTEGLYENGTYLYGMLMLFAGNRAEGRQALRSLGWERSRRRGDRCWKETKLSLMFVIIPRKNEYIFNMNMHSPPESCHLNDMDTRCRRCYIYKQMWKFFELTNENYI